MDGRTEEERAELRRMAEEDRASAEEFAEDNPTYSDYLHYRARFRDKLADYQGGEW